MIWIDVSEQYECSNEGHIRNKKTKRVLKEFIVKDGYVRTQFDGKTQTIHRVIAKAFLPQETGKVFVNHKNGNKHLTVEEAVAEWDSMESERCDEECNYG